MKLLHALALSTTLAFGGVALANDHGGKGEHHKGDYFKKIDTNGDGAISKDEHLAHSNAKFAEIDANKDGKVTKEEMKAHHEAKREHFKEMKEKRAEAKGEAAPASK